MCVGCFASITGKTSLNSQVVLKIHFQKSPALEIYTALSYDVKKVVSIVRSDFKRPKLVKLSPGTVKACLHSPGVCIVSLTRV